MPPQDSLRSCGCRVTGSSRVEVRITRGHDGCRWGVGGLVGEGGGVSGGRGDGGGEGPMYRTNEKTSIRWAEATKVVKG